MQGPHQSATRLLSEDVLELAMCADEITHHCAPRVPLPVLTAADQRTLHYLFNRCGDVITAAKGAQDALAPYLREMAA